MRVSASLVLYKEEERLLSSTIESFLKIEFDKELIIIDNGENYSLVKPYLFFPSINYLSSSKNIGFGAGHNLAFNSLSKPSSIHLILNPDISFDKEINSFLKWFLKEKEIVLALPKVLYSSDLPQPIVRKIPTLFSLLKRKLKIDEGVLDFPDKEILEIPSAHGCFFAFKPEVFKELKGFDERFFLYLEDIDIWMRAKKYGKTVINPNFHIYHHWRRASSKDFKAFLWHLQSWVKFFKKYPHLLFK
ncbi:MAG: glycosyltransferase family 2 protein [Epsilonproteobacteria bacterium]|nr:glycosyltransferase family 2 protein [Campylobacterota bacterium]